MLVILQLIFKNLVDWLNEKLNLNTVKYTRQLGPTLTEISKLLIKDNSYLSVTDSVPSFAKME